MSSDREFRSLAGETEPQRYIADVLPWVHEAGNPYFDWLLGGWDEGRAAVRGWLERESSEISIRRVTAMFNGAGPHRPVGGFVGLSGAELQSCARADCLSALRMVGREGRPALLERARAVADLRRPVEHDAWYLSKLGVLSDHRRNGYGRALLEEFLSAGEREGFSRFRLDVWSEDEHTARLYESAGFRTIGETYNDELGLKLVAMGIDR